MSLSTLTELKADIAEWLADDTLGANIPNFITLGEARLNRKLRHKSMMQSADITLSTVNKYVALPTGWMETISFNNDLGEAIEAVTFEELEDLGYGASGGRPEYYVINDQINFERVGGSALVYPMTYWKRLDIAADETNEVLTNHPDCYLYSSLMAAEPFLKNDSRTTLWAELATSAIKEANSQNSRSRRELRTDLSVDSFNIVRGY
jgi:hypothetical protein